MSSEISEILNGVKNGEQSSFDRLRSKYAPLISKEVFSFSQSGAGSENELREEAERALLSAAVSFDETKNIAFGYYAKICIRNALITVRRAVISKEKRLNKIDPVPGKRRKRSFEAFDGLSRDEIMEKISAVLSPYERRVFLMSLDGKKAHEIAAIVGNDEKSVNNAIFRSRQKIRNMTDKK